MNQLFKLSKTDLWWLENKFARFKQLDREIAVRKEELKIKKLDENTGGGKTNIVSKPVESEVIKSLNDEYIREREKWKKGIQSVYSGCTEEEKQILKDKFWNNTNYLSWTEVGEMNFVSKSKIYEIRYSIMERFAKEIGYI